MSTTNSRLLVQAEHTAVRVALWRALHTEIDEKPLVFDDSIGAQIAGEDNWRERPDMNPDFCKPMRASTAGRARFIEDLIKDKFKDGIDQYVILGAGLDTFAQRNADLISKLNVFEIDEAGPQKWKEQRIKELNLPYPKNLNFVPVDFESGESWSEKLSQSHFDIKKPAIIVSTGVSMYLSEEANKSLLSETAKFQKGTVFAMTFMLALELLEEKERELMKFVMRKATESGTPFLSLFKPDDIIKIAKDSGFSSTRYVSAKDLFEKYFSMRTDNLNAGNAEAFLVANI